MPERIKIVYVVVVGVSANYIIRQLVRKGGIFGDIRVGDSVQIPEFPSTTLPVAVVTGFISLPEKLIKIYK